MELLLDGQLRTRVSAEPTAGRLTRNSRPWRWHRSKTAMSEPSIKEQVRENSARAAQRVTSLESGGCCGTAAPCGNPITSNLYADSETGALPAEAVAASLGGGHPTALAELTAAETVPDLGSGGGIDVLLSARRVGPSGKAGSPQTIKQHLASIKMLFDYRVVSQIVPVNPPAPVKGPTHVVKRGKTPVL